MYGKWDGQAATRHFSLSNQLRGIQKERKQLAGRGQTIPVDRRHAAAVVILAILDRLTAK
jgi:hypothetical protein